MEPKEPFVPKLDALGITILRVTIGIVFAAHGEQKLVVLHFAGVARNFAVLGLPRPDICAVAVTLLEFIGGLMLILGLFSRWPALLLAAEMLLAIFFAHLRHGFAGPNGFEHPLTLLVANLVLAFNGPGWAALDSKLKPERIFR
jgi:putative oxidoreductase